MRTTVSSKGRIVLPVELRRMDRIEPGQEFDVKRLDRGDYRLVLRPAGSEPRHRRLVACLPAEGFLHARRIWVDRFAVKPTKAQLRSGEIAWLRAHEQ